MSTHLNENYIQIFVVRDICMYIDVFQRLNSKYYVYYIIFFNKLAKSIIIDIINQFSKIY